MSTSLPSAFTRRQFLQTSAAAAGLTLTPPALSAADPDAFSFALLGDLHFDKLEHHDMAWLEKHKAGDLNQIKNYSSITAEITPRLFAAVRQSVSSSKAAFVLQVGDLVQGLCGTEELSAQQNVEALAFVRDADLGTPFVFTKGNHDVTGDGAKEAFQHIFQPFLSEQTAGFKNSGRLTSANYTIEHAGALFCFFDAYDPRSLDWLEAVLAKRTTRHCFVVIHPPVVPYGARATWHLFAKAADRPKRDKLLGLLGKHNAFVLGGHIHKFNTLTRLTPDGGRFVQLAVSSVVNSTPFTPKDQLSGIGEYTGDQIRVEPAHSPETAQERRAVYDAERAFVTTFEYATLPGHAVVTVNGDQVTAEIFSGVSQQLWKTVDLTKAMRA